MAEWEILVLKDGYCDFLNPPYKASRQLMSMRIAAAGISLNPLPCQAWRSYMVTN
jgi:hypothetical protein